DRRRLQLLLWQHRLRQGAAVDGPVRQRGYPASQNSHQTGGVDMTERARVYAGTHDGVQVLSLRGAECELVAEAFPDEIVQALGGCREKTERVFTGLRNGLFRTDDAGAHWRKVLDGDFRS